MSKTITSLPLLYYTCYFAHEESLQHKVSVSQHSVFVTSFYQTRFLVSSGDLGVVGRATTDEKTEERIEDRREKTTNKTLS